MIKSDQEFYIKSQQQLIIRLMKLLDWVLECEKKVHKAETDSWYLNWKVSYLEKKLKELDIPLYSGSQVKLAFYQKPYILKDATTYGTSLKLVGVQVISTVNVAGVAKGELDVEEVSNLFGTTEGYKVGDVEDDF